MSIYGTIHNAKRCTIDGRDYYIAAVCAGNRLLYEGPIGRRRVIHVSGHQTSEEARRKLIEVAKKREYRQFKITEEG